MPPGGLTASVVTLTGPEGHHAAAVRRLRPGERADVSDGAGTLAEGVVSATGKDSVTLDIRAVRSVPPPQPRLAVAQALPKGDRGELAVELMTEVGVDAVIPWAAARSITRWQAERGEKALAKWRSTAREAAKQSRRAWLPEVTPLASTAALAERVAAAACAILLEADAPAKLPRPAAARRRRDPPAGGPRRRDQPGRAGRAARRGRGGGAPRPDGAAHLDGRRDGRGGPAEQDQPLVARPLTAVEGVAQPRKKTLLARLELSRRLLLAA